VATGPAAATRAPSTPTPTLSPTGSPDWHVEPAGAYYDDKLGEFLLPYAAVRTAPDPDAALLSFFQTSYEAAAELAAWDRASLEVAPSFSRR
jgi:hypothetical protein